MMHEVIEAKPLPDLRLYLRFDDGLEGELRLPDLVKLDGVFAPVQDPQYFARVHVNPDLGTVCWPNGADVDPDVLYSAVSGKPVPFAIPG